VAGAAKWGKRQRQERFVDAVLSAAIRTVKGATLYLLNDMVEDSGDKFESNVAFW